MEEKLIEYFSRFQKLTPKEKDAITEDINISQVNKGSLLLKEGQVSYDNYFILKGCIRQYHLQDGEEKTTTFFTEEEWVLPSIGEEEEKPSTYFLECLEDCFLVVANENEGVKLMKRFPKFQDISRVILEREIIRQQKRLARFISSSPEQRYIDLLNDQPELINRVPLYQLSSYIGVKPESLSRIRKRINDKGN